MRVELQVEYSLSKCYWASKQYISEGWNFSNFIILTIISYLIHLSLVLCDTDHMSPE